MTERECIHWLFDEYMKEHAKAERAEQELGLLRAQIDISELRRKKKQKLAGYVRAFAFERGHTANLGKKYRKHG